MLVTIRRALLSVSDKTGLVDFARALAARNVELLSTGGTARTLRDAGLAVIDVSAYTGFPEIMDGRVKTLHPRVHGGLLGRRGVDDAVMAKHDIPPIDLLVVNLYPFAQTVAKPDCTYADAIENIDIGGPAMVRAASKNHESVTVVVDPADYGQVLGELDANDGATSIDTRSSLAAKAFAHTAKYDTMVSNYLLGRESDDAASFPATLPLVYEKIQDLRYGENPHQKAAFYRELGLTGSCVAGATMLQGKELSFNNIADTDTAVECVRVFNEPACVIVKHANPCGVATAVSLADAYDRAYRTDPTSAFGGIIAFNRELDAETATAITGRQFVEVIAAPSVSAEAAAVLAGKANVRVLVLGPLARKTPYRARISQRGRRPAGAEPRYRARAARHLQDRHRKAADADAVRGPVVRLARVQVREIERHCVRARWHDDWRRRRADVARVFHARGRAQGEGRRPGSRRQLHGLGCFLSVPRWHRRRSRIRHQGHRATRWQQARR